MSVVKVNPLAVIKCIIVGPSLSKVSVLIIQTSVAHEHVSGLIFYALTFEYQ